MYCEKTEAPLLEGRARVVRLHPFEGFKERAEHGEGRLNAQQGAN
jgi:hypothetical protein